MSRSPGSRSPLVRAAHAALTTCALLAASGPPSHAAPPPNDNFANATVVNTNVQLFTHTSNLTEATTQSGEPIFCSFTTQTVWYRFTTTTDTWLGLSASGNVFGNMSLFIDNGGGIFGLSFVNCSSFGGLPQVLARAGVSYYLQVSAFCCGAAGSVTLNSQQVPAPVPVADFFFSPSDPSSFDTVTFFDNSFDPGQQGFASRLFDYGDGTTSVNDSTSCCPQHRYAADGDYEVRLTVTTTDGRTASATRVVSVRTHDVAITDFKVPNVARLGQSKQITVSVNNTRYDETVRVELQKAVPGPFGDFQQLGSSEQFVRARPANHSTDFVFNYTVTPDDTKLGKVTFRAVAYLPGARDAFAADNTAIASPVKVGTIGPVRYTEEVFANAGLEFALLGVRPNPVRAGAELSVRLSLATEGEARLEVLDLAGRVVGSNELGVMAPGIHDAGIRWSHRPAAGIYWVRLVQGSHDPRVLRFAILD